MPKTLLVSIPLTPPSVNHYMKHRVASLNGRDTVMSYPSREAKEWWKAVGICAGGRSLIADGFEIAYVVYQGSNERGDVDNYAKCILDALVKAEVIDSDHKVTALHAYKVRDRANPRTEIFIRPVGQLALLDAPMPAKEDW
jgi:Holliday junction resolvase RusA-like endonuclease